MNVKVEEWRSPAEALMVHCDALRDEAKNCVEQAKELNQRAQALIIQADDFETAAIKLVEPKPSPVTLVKA